ncbi:MAG: polyphenol oxidase family protein [Propionibacteriaceae bacterium]|nr:polyphenol oxidase family protein [Propionibacteriaceae bacterium]
MFTYRRDPDADLGVGVAFTSGALDLSDAQGGPARAEAFARLAEEVGVPVAAVSQVHGNAVVWADADAAPEAVGVAQAAPGLVDLTAHRADAVATRRTGLGVAVRVADCVPILLAAPGAVAAVHAGRAGLLNGVITAAVEALAEAGEPPCRAWVGPHICARCYEVPEAMAEDAAEQWGLAPTMTSWGTPSLDLGAAARAQLELCGVRVEVVSPCTRHEPGLHSHRGGSPGRQVGVIWRTAR